MASKATTTLFLTTCLLVVLQGSGSSSEVVLRDNGYEGVVVALQETLPVALCPQIIQGLQAVIRSASGTIFEATKGRAQFRQVRVLVPSAWTPSSCGALGTVFNATGERWEGADLRVTRGRHPRHGARPFTLQTQGCGHQGDYVSMGQDFLLHNSTFMNGRRLAVSWLQYRYGVFSETGETGNPVHPPHYLSPTGTWTPTTCADLPVVPSDSCSPGDLTCAFNIDQKDDPGLTSSLLAFPQLETVGSLCDEGSHDREAPTRHNLLCGGKSVWEVMRASADFQNNRNVEGGLIENEVSFLYVRPRPPKIVLLVEDTNIMNVQKRWDFMRKAVRKVVMYDIPDAYSVGLVVFDSESIIRHPLTTLTDANREKIGSSLPRNPSQVGEHRRCVLCGIRGALTTLGGTGGHIMLVASGSGSMSSSEAEEVARLLAQTKVTLHTIIYPLTEKYPRPDGGLTLIATRSGGQSYIVPDEGIGADSKLSMYYNLLDSMYQTLTSLAPQDAMPVKVHAAQHPGGRMMMSEGSFLVDPGLGADTVFTIFYYDINHVGNVIHLVSPQNQVIDTANMQKEDANMNMIMVRLVSAQVTPGLWRYKVDNKADSHQALFVQVTSRPRPRPDAPRVNVRAWTSHKLGIVNASDISHPLALYCEVTTGVMGVEGASVTATITRLGYTINGTHHKPTTTNLLDNGLTGPDMARADGVYSRQILGLKAGQYSITVQVMGEVDGGQFTRHVRVGLVDVEGTPPTRDAFPPARVVDLRATHLPNTPNQVSFMWTAPGGDLDYGRADRYVVVTTPDQRDLSEDRGTILEGWPAPMPASSIQQHTVTWLNYDTVTYLALYAVDEEGNTGEISNIVAVFVPSPPTTTTAPPPSYPPVASANTSAVLDGNGGPVIAALDTQKLAVIFGCIGGFLIVIIAIICYCTAAHRRHRKAAASKKVQESPDAYNVAVPVTTPDFTDGKEALKEGMKKEYMSPVESWSASQLLSGHQDNQTSVCSRSDNNSDHSASTKKSYGGSSGPLEYYADGQYPYRHPGYPDQYPPPSDGYPTPTEGYPTPVEGYSNEAYSVPLEARSYISSQPSDSFLSVSCDLLPTSSGPPAYQPYPTYDTTLRSPKVPPPIPPKPKVLYTPEPYIYEANTLDPHSSTPSVASEKRVRNVTMV